MPVLLSRVIVYSESSTRLRTVWAEPQDAEESPKKGYLVTPAMAPVITDLACHQPSNDACPQGKLRHIHMYGGWKGVVNKLGKTSDRDT